MSVPKSVTEFLSQRRIAVAGVSRDERQPGNAIYRRLREQGYQVFAVNPRQSRAEGDPCWPTLDSLPGPVDGVVALTPPAQSEVLVRDCVRLGIPRIWMHRSIGQGSVSPPAAAYGRSHGVEVLEGGCPMMYCGKVDPAHACIRWVLGVMGKLPR
jgi:hypothetical protein